MSPPEEHYLYREQIGAFVLGELEGGELEAMRAHLDGCPVCRAEVSALEPVVAALADADPDRIDEYPRPPGTSRSRPSRRSRGRSAAHGIADGGSGGQGWPRRRSSPS